MDIHERLQLAKRNTAEVLTETELKDLLASKKSVSAYYGTAPTGPVHLGYFIPLSKVFDFERAGIRTTILIADIHAALDDLKSKWDELKLKAEYYQKCIELALPWKRPLRFVRGSEYQQREDYLMDVLRLSTMVTVKRATRAASEVTRMKNPKVGELIYPIMQALDEQYLGVDIQIGGLDQRHIMAFAREYLPRIGYRKRVEIMTPIVTSLLGPGTKMSASEPMSHIKVYDSEDAIRKKIRKAYCPEGVVEDNPIIQICQFIVFPIKGTITIERKPKYGGDVEFESFDELRSAYLDKKIHPADLKTSVAQYLIDILQRAREYFEHNDDLLQELGETYR
ncbi:MAG: tyrosine--tRNA ligase [Candidatus Thorarchaeota archaeon]